MSLIDPLLSLVLAAALPAFPAGMAPASVLVACDAAYLGVYILSAEEGGASVTSVMPGSPAEELGLQPGDRIVGLGGEEVGGAEGLMAAIDARSAGDEVELIFHRGDEHVTKTVRLGKRAEAEASGHFPSPAVAETSPETAATGGAGAPRWRSFEGSERLPTAFSTPSGADHGSEQLEQRLDELRRRMDERFADLSQRLQALREERQDGAFHERMGRLQAELEAERAEQEQRAEELRATLRAQAEAQAEAQQQYAQGLRSWASFPSTSAASADEVKALREEVRALREEIRSLKELMTR